jgi:hypothetical protein
MRAYKPMAVYQAAADAIRARRWAGERVSWVEACEAVGLTPLEQRVCELVGEGMTMADVATAIGSKHKQRAHQLAERARRKLHLPASLFVVLAPNHIPQGMAWAATGGELTDQGRKSVRGGTSAFAPYTPEEREWQRLEREADAILAGVA